MAGLKLSRGSYSPFPLHGTVREYFIVVRENRLSIKVVAEATNLLRGREGASVSTTEEQILK